MQTRASLRKKEFITLMSQIEPKKIDEALKDESWVEDIKEELDQFKQNQYGIHLGRNEWCKKGSDKKKSNLSKAIKSVSNPMILVLKDLEDLKDQIKSIEKGLVILQESIFKLLKLGKDTSTDVGKVRMTIDGFKLGVGMVRQEFTVVRTLVRKKFKMMFKAIEQSKQQYEDEDSEPQHMDYDSVETSPQRFNPNVVQNLNENEDGTKQIDICFYYLRKKSKYDPNRYYKFSTVDCNFMNIIRSIYDVYSMDDSNLTTGGQVAHLNEYISGFRMHVVVPWNIVEDIYIPFNIKEKYHYVLAVLSFSERCIFLYDSYESSGHYPAVFAQIKKLAEIIPLCLQTCDFYSKKGIDLQNYPRYKEKDYSYLFDMIFEENFPQQPSESLDCGVFMVMYAECLSYGYKTFATEFDLNGLRTRYFVLLWDYGIRKQEVNVHSDVEAPLRPARQNRITSVTEGFDV
ncbi:hypothetical protein T459_32887 [Capsicum annuum]|uniref:Ubiquitin-like protease family profile domain-containing protein n=1 Tax=Capsicum annuum TaxID=4072 RepID=A0A2G2Y0H1_CAPAN|nr:hypothetical protein T459_32887 [Capsicum annuum]